MEVLGSFDQKEKLINSGYRACLIINQPENEFDLKLKCHLPIFRFRWVELYFYEVKSIRLKSSELYVFQHSSKRSISRSYLTTHHML